MQKHTSVIRTILACVAVSALSAGCGGGGGDGNSAIDLDDIESEGDCSRIFREGARTSEVVKTELCNEGDQLEGIIVLTYECDDGVTLYSAPDFGWGRADGPWHTKPKRAPSDVILNC